MNRFRAVVATQPGPATLQVLTDEDLPAGDVTVNVSHSALNYKDGLAVTGKGKIMRSYPMVAGIDLAGTIDTSESPDWSPGDEVIITGHGLSEHHPGGFTERQRVRSEWLTAKPEALSFEQATAIGTAGITAMLCILALEHHGLDPDDGPVVVTGAGGGVGSLAIILLNGLDYDVTASTGRAPIHDHLRSIGANTIIGRYQLAETAAALESEQWAGGIDTVGSNTLANLLAQTRYGGAIAACGLAGGSDLPTTVFPFILRNVALLGIDSNQSPAKQRERAWQRLATDLDLDLLEAITTVEPLTRVAELAEQILAGQTLGRVVIDTTA